MELLPGFVTIPRLAGPPRPAGAFFSATVESRVGPQSWKISLDGRSQIVTTELPLVPGQQLKLKSTGISEGRWILQVLPTPPGPAATLTGAALTPLMTAFFSQGLPAAAEKLHLWTQWLATGARPSDKESWAAGLDSRSEPPRGPVADVLEPWLAWQQTLEEGRSEPPPNSDEFWDLWNLKTPPGGSPWLVVPLRWEYEGVADAGLLQARWNAPAQAIDRWSLTAAPAGVPFRLDAVVGSSTLDLSWKFFREQDRKLWAQRTQGWDQALSQPGLIVTVTIAPTAGSPTPLTRGIDVQA